MSSIYRFRRQLGGALLLSGMFASTALAAPPAAPDVTVGADTKQLQFDWSIVQRSNYYELWFKANDGAPYVKFSESQPWRPRAVTSVSAHLLDWQQARYQVRACNPSGCGVSAPIAVADRLPETIGYFKAQRLHNNARFGVATAISEDGNTLAAFTAGETAPEFPQAAIYVFAKVDGQWRQQARIFPQSSVPGLQNIGLQPGYEPGLSLSADGSVLAAAMAFSDGRVASGGVTIYRRAAGAWTQEHQVIQVQQSESYIGLLYAEIDEAGEHVLFRAGTFDPVEVIVHGPTGWTRTAIRQVPSDLRNGYVCPAIRFSGDGQSIVWACAQSVRPDNRQLFVSRPPGWELTGTVPLDVAGGYYLTRLAVDYDASTIALGTFIYSNPELNPRNEVRLFRAANPDANTWQAAEILTAGSWSAGDENQFGTDLALSRDGKLLAVLDPRDRGLGTGVRSPPLQAGTEPTGATYVFELRAQGFSLRRVLKPNNPIPAGGIREGKVRFANNGKTLVVSEPEEPGNTTGIDGDRTIGGRPRTGAVWLY